LWPFACEILLTNAGGEEDLFERQISANYKFTGLEMSLELTGLTKEVGVRRWAAAFGSE